MEKNNILITFVIIFVLILLGVGIYFGVTQQSITLSSSSGYKNFQVKGQESITYSVQTDNINSGFTNIHLLEGNGKEMCSKCEFTNQDTQWQTAIKFLKGDFSTTRFKICQGDCESFESVAENMKCSADGTINMLCEGNTISSDRCQSFSEPYSFIGTVSYSNGNGFVCDIGNAKGELLDRLPKELTRPDGETRSVSSLGFSGRVKFERIDPNEKTEYYRFQNNECSLVSLLVSEVTSNDSLILSECENNIVGEEQPSDYYRFSNNQCSLVSLLQSEKTDNDFLTVEECELNIQGGDIIDDIDEVTSEVSLLTWIVIGVSVIFIIIIIVFIVRRKK